MRRQTWWSGWLLVLACCLAGTPLAAQAPAASPPASAADELIETARAEARKFKNVQPPAAWESSEARQRLQALWGYGREHRGTADGARATVESLRLLQALGRNAEMSEKVELLGIEEPVWKDVAWVLLQEALASGSFDRFVAKTTWVAENTRDATLRAQLWFTLGRVYREQGRRNEAEAAFEKAAAAPEPELAAAARGAIHELWNLNEGQPAPAFTARALQGGEVSLAKLRGKVVIVDFWGTR